MYSPFLNQQKTFLDQVVISMSTNFIRYTLNYTKNNMGAKNKYVVSLLIFYRHRNTTISNVIGTVVYFFFRYCICLDYLCFNQHKFPNLGKFFKNTTYEYLSGIVIPYIRMKIMLCRSISILSQYIFILTHCNKIFSYYLLKVFCNSWSKYRSLEM